MQRRSALKLLAASAAIQPLRSQTARASLQFLTEEQFRAVDQLCELILPADDHSPGAREAEVAGFVDAFLASSEPAVQQQWRAGLAALDDLCRRRFASAFSELSPGRQDEALALMAAAELDPQTDLDRLFVALKDLTIRGYYASPVGLHQELDYKGNLPLAEFPGCDHPEHRS